MAVYNESACGQLKAYIQCMEIMIYRVAVTEIYRKVVSVEARSEHEVHQQAWNAWDNTEIILGIDNFEEAEMSVRTFSKTGGCCSGRLRLSRNASGI